MSFDFSTLITDRSPEDLQALRDLLATPMADWTTEQLAQFNMAVSKGTYNYTDLNRVISAMDDINERLTAAGYVTGYHPIIVHPETPPPTPTLPEGYTELEYIESSGTQYIDTGFKPNQDSRVIMDFQLATAYSSIRALFGVRDAESGTAALQFVFWNNGATTFWTDYYGTQQTIDGFSVTQRYTVDKNKNITYIGGKSVSNNPATGQDQYNLVLFAINNLNDVSYGSAFRLYSSKIYDNGTLIRDFVPCQNPTGNVGLYDLVGAQFYGNAGTGSFTGGPEVSQPELEPDPDPSLDPYTWYEEDVPTATQMQRYLANVAALRGALELPENTVGLPGDMTGLTQAEANAIEGVLGIIEGWIQNMAAAWFYSGDLYAGEV